MSEESWSHPFLRTSEKKEKEVEKLREGGIKLKGASNILEVQFGIRLLSFACRANKSPRQRHGVREGCRGYYVVRRKRLRGKWHVKLWKVEDDRNNDRIRQATGCDQGGGVTFNRAEGTRRIEGGGGWSGERNIVGFNKHSRIVIGRRLGRGINVPISGRKSRFQGRLNLPEICSSSISDFNFRKLFIVQCVHNEDSQAS